MRITTLSLAISSILLASGAASADVGFRIGGNRLVTWFEDDDAPPGENWVAPSRLFDGDLNLVSGIITTNEPGFNGEDGTLTGFHLGFNIQAAARVWDVAGQNFNTFSPLTLTMSAPLVGGIATPVSDPASPIVGPSVLVSAGEFDFHYDYTLNGITPGLYLLKLQITTDKPGIAPSLPYYVIEDYGMPIQEHEAALAWVQSNLLPAPGAGIAILLCAPIACRRRR